MSWGKDKATPADMYTKGEECFNEKNLNEALRYYDKVLELDPSFVKAFASKAWTLPLLERYEDFISYYNKVLELEPADVS